MPDRGQDLWCRTQGRSFSLKERAISRVLGAWEQADSKTSLPQESSAVFIIARCRYLVYMQGKKIQGSNL